MSFKAVFKTIFFLILLFVMLYVGMNNTDNINFSFPMATKDKINAPAALIFFGLFAIGVLAGTLMHSGGGKSSGGGGGGGGKKSSGGKDR
jgi:uncharacterized integral membrane protein